MQHPAKKQPKKRPGRRGAWAALGLLAAIAFAAAAFTIRDHRSAASLKAVVYPSTARTLELREAAEIDRALVQPDGAEPYTIVFQDGTPYLLEGDESIDLNDVYADDLTNALTQIVAQETVTENATEVQEHLADMGLEPARACATILYTDGTSATVEVGAAVPNTTYAYYRWSGDSGIYMCDVGIRETFALSRSHLLPVEQPDVQTVLVEEVKVSNANGVSVYTFENAVSGKLVEPYAYPLADGSVDTLLSALANFRLGTAEGELRPDDRAAYGLDQPLCTVDIRSRAGSVSKIDESGELVVAEVDAQSIRFAIGRAEGDYFYTCEYEDQCYLVSRFLVETLVNLDPDEHVTHTPAAPGEEALAAIRIEAPQGTWEMQVERTERVMANNQLETDASGNIVYDEQVTVNGTQATAEQLDDWLQRLNSWTVAGMLPQDFTLAPDAQPRWRIQWVSAAGHTRSVTGYRMDAFSDAVEVDGVMKHYIHSDAIASLTAGL